MTSRHSRRSRIPFGLLLIVSDGHPVLDYVTSVHDCVVTPAG
jgi:hypothetical protein